MINEYDGISQTDPELKLPYFLAADDDEEPVGSTTCPGDGDGDEDETHPASKGGGDHGDDDGHGHGH